jgi:hypothetical protein
MEKLYSVSFRVIQKLKLDYIESLNNDENPNIISALENALLSKKAKNISEKYYETFEKDIHIKFENKYPLEINEIYKEYFEIADSVLLKFSESVNDILNVKQASNYILNLFARIRDELENILETNKTYYDEWYDQEYEEFTKGLTNIELSKLEDAKIFFNSFTNQFQTSLTKFLKISNSESCGNFVDIFLKILNNNLFDKLRQVGTNITDLHISSSKEANNQIENLNAELRRTRVILDEKNKEKLELYTSKIELVHKYEKLLRDLKSNEREYNYNMNFEMQKYQKLESNYANLINEKDKIISSRDEKIEKLTKEINDLYKEHSNKIIEVYKENSKLQIELESIRGQKKVKKAVYSSHNVNLQSLFKTIQNIFMEFKDSVDKLNKEKENVLKSRYQELSTKEIEGKS